MNVREELLKTKLTLVHIICYKCPIWDNKFPRNLFFCWLGCFIFFSSFSHVVFFYELCICIKWDLLSLDTNLHKVQAIIGWREANYFSGKITLFFFFLILTNHRQRLLTALSQICKVSLFSKAAWSMKGKKKKSERWYYSIKSHIKLTWDQKAVPVQPPTCPPVGMLNLSISPWIPFRSGIQVFWGKKNQET